MKLTTLLLLLTLAIQGLAQDTLRVDVNGKRVYTEIIQPTVIRDTVYVDAPTEPPGRVEAESFVDMQGVQMENDVVGFIEPGDWMQYEEVNLTGAKSLKFRYSLGAAAADRKMQLRTGSITGTVIAEWAQKYTGDWNNFSEDVIQVSETVGVHDLYITFTGPAGWVCNLDWFEFSTEEVAAPEPEPEGKYFVSPIGASSGNCTTTPCNIVYAQTAVPAGETIVLNPGTYTLHSQLQVRRSMQGIGQVTFKGSFYSTAWDLSKLLMVVQTDNITLSDFTIDGENQKLNGGILIRGNNNTVRGVTVRDTNFIGIWAYSGDNNKVLHCTLVNNGGRDFKSYSTPNVAIGTTKNTEVAFCTMSLRAGIKGLPSNTGGNSGAYMQNVNIHDNNINVPQFAEWDNPSGGRAPGLTIEFQRCLVSGNIYKNKLNNNISIVQENPFGDDPLNTSPAGLLRIHDNEITPYSTGYSIEIMRNNIEIFNNYMKGGAVGIVNWDGHGRKFTNINIHHNVFEKLQSTGWGSAAVYSVTPIDIVFNNNTVDFNGTTEVSVMGAYKGTTCKISASGNLFINTSGKGKLVHGNVVQMWSGNFLEGIVSPGGNNVAGKASIKRTGSSPRPYYEPVGTFNYGAY